MRFLASKKYPKNQSIIKNCASCTLTYTPLEAYDGDAQGGKKSMEKYDYMEVMKNDIREYLAENFDLDVVDDRDKLEEWLNDELWTADSITGNASGSYFFSTWKAEEAIAHNLDLLAEVWDEFGYVINPFSKGAEWCDVLIRCYLLSRAIGEVLDELEQEDPSKIGWLL